MGAKDKPPTEQIIMREALLTPIKAKTNHRGKIFLSAEKTLTSDQDTENGRIQRALKEKKRERFFH